MSSYIFDRIHAAALASDPLYVGDQHPRWLARKSDEDSQLMADADLQFLPLGLKAFIVSIKFGVDSYYCFCGLPVSEELPHGLLEAEVTPGLFACVINVAEVPSNATASQARDILEDQYRGRDNYNGHELAEVEALFPVLRFSKVSESFEAPYLDSLERVAGAYVAAGYPGHPLEINKELRSSLISLFEGANDTVPFHLPLQGILSYTWPALFLDLYRCLEQLYSAPRLIELVSKVSHKGPLADLAFILEDVLTWRPKEEEALGGVLDRTSDSTKLLILDAFTPGVKELPDKSAEKCAKHIYRLRNSHVHFRPAMKAEHKTSGQWNDIVFAMCEAVYEAYEKLGVGFLKGSG